MCVYCCLLGEQRTNILAVSEPNLYPGCVLQHLVQ